MLFATSITHTVSWPSQKPHSAAIVPVFLPFYGCKQRCMFCAQHEQTGQKELPLSDILTATHDQLLSRAAAGLPLPELAFYGGTFTAMPSDCQAACLNFAAIALQQKYIATFRCSTRPDAVDATILARLHDAGCSTVELGIQSFSDAALAASKRGYSRTLAIKACAEVKDAGLQLGVQLLPGMPGVTPAVFLEDVVMGLGAGTDMLRFYPCLVLEGTVLAKEWRSGNFKPWSLAACIETLAKGWLLAKEANIPVIRMGLAPEPSLAQAVLAGPVHPAMGERVMGRALFHTVKQYAKKQALTGMEAPRACQGYIWGHRGELRKSWAQIGITSANITFADTDGICLKQCPY